MNVNVSSKKLIATLSYFNLSVLVYSQHITAKAICMPNSVLFLDVYQNVPVKLAI